MKPEQIIVSCLPAVFFILGMVYLTFSGLTVSKAIALQYDTFDVFLDELMKSDIQTALTKAFNYFWSNALLKIVIFLLLITFGLIIYLYFYKDTDLKVLMASQGLFLVISVLLTNFSIPISLIALSLLLGISWMHKTFEERKNNFTTGYSVITSRLNLLSIFLSIGIFLSIFMNMPTHEEQMSQSNLKLISSFIPNATELKQVQAGQVENLMEGFKDSLTSEYQNLPSDVQTQCKSMYDGMVVSIDNYKQQAITEIVEQELGGVGDVVERFPIFDLFTKITPLIIAFSVYALLSILSPLLGIFGGFVYGLMKKIRSE